jgi:hypothetical protein
MSRRPTLAGRGDIGARQILYEACFKGRTGGGHHDRDRLCDIHRRLDSRGMIGSDQVAREPDELFCVGHRTAEPGICAAPQKSNVPTFLVAEVAHSRAECCDEGVRRRWRNENAYTRHLFRLLRSHPERPCRRAGEQANTFPTPHVRHGERSPLRSGTAGTKVLTAY